MPKKVYDIVNQTAVVGHLVFDDSEMKVYMNTNDFIFPQVVQVDAIVNPTGGTPDTEARAAIVSILDALRAFGLVAV